MELSTIYKSSCRQLPNTVSKHFGVTACHMYLSIRWRRWWRNVSQFTISQLLFKWWNLTWYLFHPANLTHTVHIIASQLDYSTVRWSSNIHHGKRERQIIEQFVDVAAQGKIIVWDSPNAIIYQWGFPNYLQTFFCREFTMSKTAWLPSDGTWNESDFHTFFEYTKLTHLESLFVCFAALRRKDLNIFLS